jgi:carbonic anhydrase
VKILPIVAISQMIVTAGGVAAFVASGSGAPAPAAHGAPATADLATAGTAAHSDAAHGDATHSDAAHSDAAHSDAAHGDEHRTAPGRGEPGHEGHAPQAADPHAPAPSADGAKGHGEPGAAPAASAAEHGAPVGAEAGHGGGSSLSPDEVVQSLLEGNRRFVAGMPAPRDWRQERSASAPSQHPDVMVLSCSDSRAPPELLFDRGIGEVFTVRNAGNVVDPVVIGSLEYAAEHLQPKVLVVLGHEKCGAVTAAASGEKMPTKGLDAVVKGIAPALTGVKQWASGSELVHLGVEANVSRTSAELLRQSPWLAARVKAGKLKVVRAVYDIDSGVVRPLP